MNLQQLEHLLAVLETGSFSLAAEAVHLTQPALSRSIQALESELGGQLIDRIGRRKILTPLGEIVAVRARRVKLETSEIKRSAALLVGLEMGNVRLGLGPAPTSVLAAPLMQYVAQHYPGIRISISNGPAELQLQSLRVRTLDALVMHRRLLPASDDLNIRLLPTMRLGFICRKGHPGLAAGLPTFSVLRQYPLVAGGLGLSDEVVQSLNSYFGNAVHFEEALRFQSDELFSLLEMVRTTDAIFFGTVEATRLLLDREDLVEIQLSRPLGLTSQFAFITLEGISETPALRMVRNFCTDKMRDRASDVLEAPPP
ncbi:LysR family transcriptional regulator [Variovorax sp. LT1R16]|uniref:LysR family transcriptional regulator n=1 Tax=Variovorax sp. LT1R16 TaxID=3443728 RepID=UPI003F460C64